MIWRKEIPAMETGDILEVESEASASRGSLAPPSQGGKRGENNNSTAFLCLLSSNHFPACRPFEIFLPPAPGKQTEAAELATSAECPRRPPQRPRVSAKAGAAGANQRCQRGQGRGGHLITLGGRLTPRRYLV